MKSFFIIAITSFILDQGIKTWIMSHLHFHETIPIIPGFFNITYITNSGAAFGILANSGKWGHIFFQVVSFAALGGLAYLVKQAKNKHSLLVWGAALIFGGALGNLMDRIRFKQVIDFLDFYIGRYHWPAFNIADSCITIGGLLLAIYFFKYPDSNPFLSSQ